MSLSKDVIGGTIQNFQWNPAIPNIFAYIDGLGSVSTFEIDINSKQLKVLGRSDANDDYSSSLLILIIYFSFLIYLFL